MRARCQFDTLIAKWTAGDYRVTRWACDCGATYEDWELID